MKGRKKKVHQATCFEQTPTRGSLSPRKSVVFGSPLSLGPQIGLLSAVLKQDVSSSIASVDPGILSKSQNEHEIAFPFLPSRS
jgi:hypothetical protein